MAALFSLAEINIACGLEPHVFPGLKRRGLGPQAAIPSVPGGRPKWDVTGLCEFALLGAAYEAFGGLTLAAKLAEPLVSSFVKTRGYLPVNMNLYKEARAKGIEFPDGDEFERHEILAAHPDIYKTRTARDDDLSYFIADRRFVYSGVCRPKVVLLGHEKLEDSVEPEFLIDDWRWGSTDSEILTPFSEMGDEIAKYEEEARSTWQNAQSLVAVNASLAIRNAFDRMLLSRKSVEAGNV